LRTNQVARLVVLGGCVSRLTTDKAVSEAHLLYLLPGKFLEFLGHDGGL